MIQSYEEMSPCSRFMKIVYNSNLMEEIKEYWKKELYASKPSMDEKFYYRLQGNPPWFGDFEGWWAEMEGKKQENDKLWSYFPSNIREQASELACEMDYLFPKSYLSKFFLPILITSYSFQRRSSKGKKQPLIKALFEQEKGYLYLSKRVSLLSMSYWRETYSKLNDASCKLNKYDRILPIYIRIILFLTFLVKTKDVCNVTWSFYTFECMTGYLHLLGNSATSIIDSIDAIYFTDIDALLSTVKDDKIEKNIVVSYIEETLSGDALKDDICRYAEELIQDFWGEEGGEGEDVSAPEFSYNFARVVLNLKRELSPIEKDLFTLEEQEKDPLWGVHIIEEARAVYLESKSSKSDC